MTCKKTEKIGLYLGAHLTMAEKETFERHLKTCRRCSAELRIFSKLKDVVAENESRIPIPDVMGKVLRRISEPRAVSRKRPMGHMGIAASPRYKPKKK